MGLYREGMENLRAMTFMWLSFPPYASAYFREKLETAELPGVPKKTLTV